MEVKHKKTSGLFALFLRYLSAFCGVNILFVFLLGFGFYYSLMHGILLPANYGEQMLKNNREALETSRPFNSALVPFTCTYALFDKNGAVLEGNMNQRDTALASQLLSGDSPAGHSTFFLIERSDSFCIVKYDLLAHFASPSLHRLFPKPELMLIPVFLGGFILSAVAAAVLFGRNLKQQLSPLIKATEAIKRQELTFDVSPGSIREFNRVLDSINSLKATLQASLEQQWQGEQNKRIQLAALTHDIKTPLTIIKGNTELILESELSQEPMELAAAIHSNAEKIEQYICLLMDAVTAENMGTLNYSDFSVSDLLEALVSQAKELCLTKNLGFTLKTDELPEHFQGDRLLIFRGLINIIDNAVEYSPPESEICLFAGEKNKMLSFTVTDCGRGFSQAALKQAPQQFYTEQAGRTGRHYGLGLFVSKSAAQKHGGSLILANRKDTSGASVTMTLYNTAGNS